MSDDLKPCPFCGGSAKLIDDRTAWYVECTRCGVVVIGERASEWVAPKLTHAAWDLIRNDAIMKWNRRATIPKNSNL